ncbi:integrase catalytic domain-containing protein [Trichonephila clavata]|uniref:Integrase catalytic domain-containing protein n=1 Tax=Trichonephila clavata TaxID=2740835 RepID=A0A8X6KPF1_TRICU|nr:integrase catalytic domain-containing protein [Trichonephila clavata]
MNAIQQKRTTIRGAFTKSANNLEALLSELSDVKCDEIEVTLEQLSVKFKQLKECDDQVLDLLQQEKCSQDIYEKEYLSCEKYEDRFIALKTKEKKETDLLSLYDKLQTQLMALDSLGVTNEKYADIIFPLVESCLPSEILKAWERSRFASHPEITGGHRAIFCKSNVRCFACRNWHFPILCPGLASKLDHNFPNNANNTKVEETVSNTLNSHVRHSDVYLQTLIVRLHNDTKEMLVRAIFDTDSMKSYISSDIVKSMNYKSKNEVNLKQSLFGGIETVESVYNNYVIELSNVDGGYRDPAQLKSKIELEQETNKYFNETISVNSEGRYEVALPWIVDNSFLSENKMLAEKSLSTKGKLASTGKVEAYNGVFENWLSLGIIERVSEAESQRVHYLPHRPVFKENSTTSLRPVFNASSYSAGS